jgi:hypothetical protein
MFHQHLDFIHLQEVINSIQVCIKKYFFSILINHIYSALIKILLNLPLRFSKRVKTFSRIYKMKDRLNKFI